MAGSTSRWRAIRAVRRGAQASALRELAIAEEQKTVLAARTAALQAELDRQEALHHAPRVGEVTPAGLLASAVLAQHTAAARRGRLERKLADLRGQLALAESRVTAARRAAADATRALRHAEERLRG